MAWWITVYCTECVSQISPEQLLEGICDGDPDAPAGVDYDLLAEVHEIDDSLVGQALASLRAENSGDLPLEASIHYVPEADARPVQIHCWNTPERVAEELEEGQEVRSPPASAIDTLKRCKEVVAIELGMSQLGTMAVVIAYEMARYLAQKGAGVIVDDEDQWFAVEDGVFTAP